MTIFVWSTSWRDLIKVTSYTAVLVWRYLTSLKIEHPTSSSSSSSSSSSFFFFFFFFFLFFFFFFSSPKTSPQ
ncbi:hypothetical protein SprV_0200585600 [Sparganum proliferum]